MTSTWNFSKPGNGMIYTANDIAADA